MKLIKLTCCYDNTDAVVSVSHGPTDLCDKHTQIGEILKQEYKIN